MTFLLVALGAAVGAPLRYVAGHLLDGYLHWGTILVNGVNRGVSPPLKRLSLPAGQHTIRIINPSVPEHTVTVNSVKGANAVIELDFTEGDSE